MLNLVQVKSLDQVSVRDLCAEASLSHPTFYRSYSSKEEIVGEIAAKEMKQLMDRMMMLVDQRDPSATAELICDYIEENRTLWTTLLTTGAGSVMRDEWIRLSQELALQRPPINPDLPTRMVSAVFAAGMLETLAWWLQQPEDYPKKNIAQFLERLILKPTISSDIFSLK